VYVTDDRERDWPTIRRAERYRMSIYNKFMAETPDDYGWGDADAIPQGVIVGTPEECIAELRSFIDTFGITDIASSGLPPGIDEDWANRNIERLANDVIPALR
jgi:alkanesulfonate monooxygenase SsuD/methylene tetrahydromethanopterin reductase-like flavin-dependent oxidoreductase (luciferase family)